MTQGGGLMVQIVGIHGIGKQRSDADRLWSGWQPALAAGIAESGHPVPEPGEFAMAFYGDLFRRSGTALAGPDPFYDAQDVEDGIEADLLFAWWEAAAAVDPAVVAPDAETLVRWPKSVQAALRALSGSKFFSGVALRAMVFDLKQVRRYLTDDELRGRARRRLAALITDDTRVVVAHSLGSVVAYECLHELPGHGVRALVTLGSPLGVPTIRDRLAPPPGAWPGDPEMTWTNVVDAGDVVALVKDLGPEFGDAIVSVVQHNGSHAHEATAYLAGAATGRAIAEGLGGQ